MGIAVATFAALFLLLASGGALLFYRSDMTRRLGAVLSKGSGAGSILQRLSGAPSRVSVGAWVQPLEKVLPRSPEEVSVVQKRLIRAGDRSDADVQVFYGTKVLVPVLLCLIVTITGAYEYGAFFLYALALGLGFLAPDFWLGHRISARQTQLRLGLPDALDLMVICLEAGLSPDQAPCGPPRNWPRRGPKSARNWAW